MYMNNLIATFTNSTSPLNEHILEKLISEEIVVKDIFEIQDVIEKVELFAHKLKEHNPNGTLDVLVIKEDGTIIIDGSIKEGFIGKVYPIL